MKRHRILVTVLVLLLAVNFFIFFYRDTFQYQPESAYEDLYGTCDGDCKEEWARFTEGYEGRELETARRILRDSFRFTPQTPQEEKLRTISGLVMGVFVKRHGFPSAEFLRQSPMEQYQNLCLRDSGRLWCGNLAQIFSFFCFAEGITTRNIEIRNPGDHHVVNECYLDREKKWVLMDVPHGLILVKDSAGNFLDLQTFSRSVRKNDPVFLSANGRTGQPFDIRPAYFSHFYLNDHPHYYYYELNDERIYSTSRKIRRYLLPVSWYEIYSETPSSNWKFYLKQLFHLLLVLFLFLSMWSAFTRNR